MSEYVEYKGTGEKKMKSSLCSCCKEKHEIKLVQRKEQVFCKKIEITYEAVYRYCDKKDEFYEDKLQQRKNDMARKNAYRKKKGLLTSKEIIEIRNRYGISQRDFCLLLGWGGKTITRYETNYVQDRAHDHILRKIDSDPEWFLQLLEAAKEELAPESYGKYFENGMELYGLAKDEYKRKASEAKKIYLRRKNENCI